jgi:hypothetical protein
MMWDFTASDYALIVVATVFFMYRRIKSRYLQV